MKRKMMLILLMSCLTACLKAENTMPSSEVSVQTEILLESTDITTIESDKSIDITEQIGAVPSLIEVGMDEFPFADMEYISLVEKGGPHHPDDGATMFYEYALLGGDWDTYEKGRECYETINSLYEGKPTNLENIEQNRRHISYFSSEGERVLIKDYAKQTSLGDHIIYELYEGLTPVGSYIYIDIFSLSNVNYTKSLQFINLDYSSAGFSGIAGDGSVIDFYKTSQLSPRYKIDDVIEHDEVKIANLKSININVADPEIYEISRVTNPTDTIYYSEDSDEEGKQCIGIYTVDDNKLMYQSKAIEQGIEIEKELEIVSLLDEKVIVGVTASDTNRTKFQNDDHGYTNYLFDYYEIDINSGEWIYLFTDIPGGFSPDGKFFAGGFWTEESLGYQIMCLDSGEYINLTVYVKSKETSGYYNYNEAVCWVKKDKIDELLQLAAQ